MKTKIVVVCESCKKIIIENMTKEEIKELGNFIECPYCGMLTLNEYY